MPFRPDDKLLVHLHEPAPAGWLEAMRARFPGLAVRWEIARPNDAGTDLQAADALPADALAGVTMLCVLPPPRAEAVRGVRLVQLVSAGSDRWPGHALFEDPDVVFCSSSGCQAPPIAEWVIGSWLFHQRHFRTYEEQQRQGVWKARIMDKPVADSMGRRMGIMGYGAIGRQCARLAQALGMQVYAFTRTARDTPEARRHDGYSIPGTGDPDGLVPARWFHGDVDDFLAQDLDLVVVSVPLSPATRGLIGRPQFQAMSAKKTFLCNVARGPIVDTDALVEALEQGLISGAALDVTDPEPLPPDHPLWKAPNVTITPHVSWQSNNMVDRIAGLLMENMDRLDRGEPLLNVIKK